MMGKHREGADWTSAPGQRIDGEPRRQRRRVNSGTLRVPGRPQHHRQREICAPAEETQRHQGRAPPAAMAAEAEACGAMVANPSQACARLARIVGAVQTPPRLQPAACVWLGSFSSMRSSKRKKLGDCRRGWHTSMVSWLGNQRLPQRVRLFKFPEGGTCSPSRCATRKPPSTITGCDRTQPRRPGAQSAWQHADHRPAPDG